jgi:uncharacterized protein (TIGR02466 family)
MKALPQNEVQKLLSLHQNGSDEIVVQNAQSLIKVYPQEIILHNILGVSLEKLGLFSEAAIAYKSALDINSTIPELNLNLGAMLYALKKSDDAVVYYKKAIKLNPNFVEAFFNLGIVLQSQNKNNEAIESYEKAVKIQPGFYEAIANIGTIKQLEGDLDEAIELFIKSLSIHEDGRGNYNLACAYRNQGNLSLAIKYYRRAIEIGSVEAEFYSDLGDALWHEGKIEEANQFLRMAVKVNPTHPRANYQLAVFLYDNKAFDDAIKYFETSGFEDWQERVLYCTYKLENFDEFKEKLLLAIKKKNCSPFLATLSKHYSQNFKIEDKYNFCPNPLELVAHEKVEELLVEDEKLKNKLLDDIKTSEIAERKQSRLFSGTQSSGNLFKRSEPSFKALEIALKRVIKKYYEKHKGKNCEFIKSFPKNYDFSSSWFVRMQSGGHLTSHIHEDGWLSGAVYLSVPKKTKNKNEGAIELSTDGDNYPKLHEDFPKETILPEEGDVIFFPSSVFHRTIPFESKEERICIAFDLRPSL